MYNTIFGEIDMGTNTRFANLAKLYFLAQTPSEVTCLNSDLSLGLSPGYRLFFT